MRHSDGPPSHASTAPRALVSSPLSEVLSDVPASSLEVEQPRAVTIDLNDIALACAPTVTAAAAAPLAALRFSVPLHAPSHDSRRKSVSANGADYLLSTCFSRLCVTRVRVL